MARLAGPRASIRWPHCEANEGFARCETFDDIRGRSCTDWGRTSTDVQTRSALYFSLHTFARKGNEARMKRLAYAVVTTAVLGAAVAAEQAANPSAPAAAPSPRTAPVKLAASHAPVKAQSVPAGLSADDQNHLVAQYCVTCHSE